MFRFTLGMSAWRKRVILQELTLDSLGPFSGINNVFARVWSRCLVDWSMFTKLEYYTISHADRAIPSSSLQIFLWLWYQSEKTMSRNFPLIHFNLWSYQKSYYICSHFLDLHIPNSSSLAAFACWYTHNSAPTSHRAPQVAAQHLWLWSWLSRLAHGQ